MYLLVSAVTSAQSSAVWSVTPEETPSAGQTVKQPAQEGDVTAAHSESGKNTQSQRQLFFCKLMSPPTSENVIIPRDKEVMQPILFVSQVINNKYMDMHEASLDMGLGPIGRI